MNRLIYINLMIDQIWARGSVLEKVFSTPIPSSSRFSLSQQNLALNYCDKVRSSFNPIHKVKNTYVLSWEPDPYWIENFNDYHDYKSKSIVTLSSDPRKSEDWAHQLAGKTKDLMFDDFVFSGISLTEEMVIKKLGRPKMSEEGSGLPPGYLSEIDHQRLNAKQFLFEFCKVQNIIFPQSELVRGIDIEKVSSGKPVIFKFNQSSGGQGQWNAEKVQSILGWIRRQSLEQDWMESIWLKQERLDVMHEYSCFGHVEQDKPEIAEIQYDFNHLSFQHDFTSPNLLPQEHDEMRRIYRLVQSFLRAENYRGYFGFDSLQTKEGFYPIVDLNVRLTKTHLLRMAMKNWVSKFPRKIFIRIRFPNDKGLSFEVFWKDFCLGMKVNFLGESQNRQVLPFDAFAWGPGQSEVCFILSGRGQTELLELHKDLIQYFRRMETAHA